MTPAKEQLSLLALVLSQGLAGCGGTQLLDEPQPMVLEQPLTMAFDRRLEIFLDWVIIRDGPGTWVESADWDEYLLRVRNYSADPVRITGLAVYDSLGTRLEYSANLNKLIDASRETTSRYRSEDLKIKAGVGGESLMAAGSVVLVGGEALGVAALAGSANAAGVALGAVVLAPVLIVGGMVQSKNKDWVAREMIDRHTPLPVDLSPGELHSLTVFFPLAPSPRKIELVYVDSVGAHTVVIDTRDILQGLHIGNTRT